jgi:hypothetical protein
MLPLYLIICALPLLIAALGIRSAVRHIRRRKRPWILSLAVLSLSAMAGTLALLLYLVAKLANLHVFLLGRGSNGWIEDLTVFAVAALLVGLTLLTASAREILPTVAAVAALVIHLPAMSLLALLAMDSPTYLTALDAGGDPVVVERVYGFHDLESEQTYRKIGGFLMKPENCTYYIGEADPPVEAETEPIS